MDLLKIYLLAGLIAHKAVWEVMKRRRLAPPTRKAAQPLKTTIVKAIKIAILIGIVAQTMLPPLFPIPAASDTLRLVGAFLYSTGLLIAILGRVQLGDNWLDIEEAGTRREQAVVANGIYGYIRHPIYTGDLLLLFGLELALQSWLVLGVAALAPVVLLQATREEQFLRSALPGYNEYCRRTKRFVPFLA